MQRPTEMNELDSLKTSVNDLKSKLDTMNGKIDFVNDSIQKIEDRKHDIELKKLNYAKAVEFLNLIQKATREKTQEEFESIISYALINVFGEGHTAKLEFGKRGNLPELDFLVSTPETEEYVDPLNCNGGGIVNVYELALRLVLLSITKNPGFLAMDEKMKEISADYQPMAYQFLKKINEKLNRQIIFVTHEKHFIDAADYKIKIGE